MAPNTDTQAVAKRGLPLMVVSPVDVGRLIRELETIDNWYLQAKLTNPQALNSQVKTSTAMEQTLSLNKWDVSIEANRKELRVYLDQIKKDAPIMHMSFSADPSTPFLDKLMSWLRREINPSILLTVGLQPNIGAGCIIRSTNKYFLKKRQLLMDLLSSTEAIK
jgi:hypothetical protein